MSHSQSTHADSRAGALILGILVLFAASLFLGSIDLEAAARMSVTMTAGGKPLPAPGKVIVVLRDDAATTAASDVAAAAGVDPANVYDSLLHGFSATVSAAELQAIARNPLVDFVAPDSELTLAGQELPTQIRRAGQESNPVAKIDGVDDAIDVDIAILDTGVQSSHPDLRVAGGQNCLDPGASYEDDHGHGTLVAGIAAAIDNDFGTVGAAPGARIWAIKVADSEGRSTASSVICGLDALDANGNPFEVVNVSLVRDDAQGACGTGTDALHEAVCRATARGTTVVAAAGNSASDVSTYTPAAYPEVITVGAITDYDGAPGSTAATKCGSSSPDDSFARYSNYGGAVDIAAPGTCVLSTYLGGRYERAIGTSMASPLVAGAAALYKAQNPGAAPAEVQAWLLSDAASRPATSPVGYSGASYRLLYLGPEINAGSVNPPGTPNPTFAGSRIPIVNAASTPSTGTAKAVYDGNGWSNWHSGHVSPATASLRVDLGGARAISGVKWSFSSLGFADSFTVRLVAANGSVLRTYGPFGNGGKTQIFYGFSVTEPLNARYVHIVFTNANRDAAVGAIGELEVWEKPLGDPGIANPSFPGSKATIVNSASTPSTGTARLAHDGKPGTNWHSGNVTPATASLRFDLGSDKEVTGIRWQLAYLGFADSFTIRLIATDGTTRDLGPFTNATQARTFFGIATSGVRARYVQVHFTNPNRDSAVGSIAEVEIWESPALAPPPGTVDPVFSGEPVTITNSASTPKNVSSFAAHDGNPWSNWHSGHVSPGTASLRLDLGQVHDVTGVRWSFSSLGYADSFRVRLVDARGAVIATYGPYGNGTASAAWYGFPVDVINETRYIHVVFENPNRDSAVGAIGEVEVYGFAWAASREGLLAASETSFRGEPLPATEAVAPGAISAQATGATRGVRPAQTVTYDLGLAQELTGIRWQAGEDFVVGLAWSADGETWTEVGRFASMTLPGQWQGTSRIATTDARFVRVTYQALEAGQQPGAATALEIWGLGDVPIAATPEASPAPAQPGASPVPPEPAASPVPATPEPVVEEPPPAATPEPATEEPIGATPEPATEEPTAMIEPTIQATATVTEEPTATEEPTMIPTVEPTATATLEPTATATIEPTATDEPAAAPTLAVTIGTITGTGGDLVNCRTTPVDGEPITQLAEGEVVDITGDAVDGWYPVICAGQPGFVSADFVTPGLVAPTEPSLAPTAEPIEAVSEEPTATPTEEAIEAPTQDVSEQEEPAEDEVVAGPYPVYDAGDTEGSGTAWNVIDGDPASAWSAPASSPQVRLYLDLGSVLPIDRITLHLAWSGSLPAFEIWLSEDGETWYNATPGGIDGWSLWSGEPIAFGLGYDARYIRLVFPHADQSGLGEIGGIGEIAVWPGDITQTSYLSALGNPTTPTPEPEPTAAPTTEPTDEVIEEPTGEWIEPTEEWVQPTEDWVEPTEEWTEPTEEWAEEPTEEWIAPTEEAIPVEEGPPAEEGTGDVPEEEARG